MGQQSCLWFSAGVTLALMSATPALARDALVVSGAWGAFRDEKPARCFAISAPDRVIAPSKIEWRPFFAVGDWPARQVMGEVHLRLSKPRKPGTPLRLRVGAQHFDLVSAGSEAWAPDAKTDAAIIAALRSSRRATVTGVARDGSAIRDGYRVDGAATAIDAARLACVRR